jgi:hypothetical protein
LPSDIDPSILLDLPAEFGLHFHALQKNQELANLLKANAFANCNVSKLLKESHHFRGKYRSSDSDSYKHMGSADEKGELSDKMRY